MVSFILSVYDVLWTSESDEERTAMYMYMEPERREDNRKDGST